MAEESVVLTDTSGGVATVTINRPDKLNALNAAVRSHFVTSASLPLRIPLWALW